MSLLSLYLDAGNTSIKEIFKTSQRKDHEPICIAMNKKEGASCITTHLPFLYLNGIGTLAKEVFEGKVLLDLFEK